MTEWEKLREQIAGLQSDIAPFRAEFLDRDSFNELYNRLDFDIRGYKQICITGYFSETIRDKLQKILRNKCHVRLLVPEFPMNTRRDKRNIEALKKLEKAGAEIKFNNRLHARLMVAYTSYTNNPLPQGLLVIGSFDFNTECIGRERYDAGIMTRNPDLLQSAIDFFQKVWNDSESRYLQEVIS